MSTKDAGLRIRVERELREAFVMACAADKRNASDVLREFMWAYAKRNPDGKQTNLFDSGDVMTVGAARKKE
jgi:hypothetical protein